MSISKIMSVLSFSLFLLVSATVASPEIAEDGTVYGNAANIIERISKIVSFAFSEQDFVNIFDLDYQILVQILLSCLISLNFLSFIHIFCIFLNSYR